MGTMNKADQERLEREEQDMQELIDLRERVRVDGLAIVRKDLEIADLKTYDIETSRARIAELQTRMSEMVYERQRANRFGGRPQRQQVVFEWVKRVFGHPIAWNVAERATRVLEEAVEVAQAAGVTKETVVKVVYRCFGRDVGNLQDEVSNLSITLLALCGTLGVSAEELERDEIERILAIPEAAMRLRQVKKFEAGIGMPIVREPE